MKRRAELITASVPKSHTADRAEMFVAAITERVEVWRTVSRLLTGLSLELPFPKETITYKA